MSIPHYTVLVCDLDEEPLEELPVKNLQYSWTLNAPGSCTFTVPQHHPKVTRNTVWPTNRIIKLYRGGRLIWGGYIWTVAASKEEEGLIRVGCEGWFSRLRRRYYDADKTWTNTDVFTFAWDLISYTQAKTHGDLGFQRGFIGTAGVNINRVFTAAERRNIGQELTNLACQQGGIDFEITPHKLWRTYYPSKGRTITRYVLEHGKNIDSYYYPVDGAKQSTELTGIGSGNLLSVKRDLTTMLSYGLLERTVSYRGEKTQAGLDGMTAEALRHLKRPREIFQIYCNSGDPPVGAVREGDHIHVKIDDGWLQVDAMKRVISLSISVANSGREVIGYSFEEALEL